MSPTCVWAGTPADLLTRICFSVSLHDPPRSASVRINILVGHWIEGHFHAPQVYWGWKTHWEKRNCEEKKCLKSVRKFRNTREIAKESPCYKKTGKKIGCDKRKEQGHNWSHSQLDWLGWRPCFLGRDAAWPLYHPGALGGSKGPRGKEKSPVHARTSHVTTVVFLSFVGRKLRSSAHA